MNKLNILLFLVMFASVLYAQQDAIVTARTVSQGFNYAQNAEIQAIEYSFPERIDEFKIDTVSGIASILLRGLSKNGKYLNNTGTFVLYDLNEQKPVWSRKINFQNENMAVVGSQVLLLKVGKVVGMNKITGAEAWTSKTRIYYADKKNQVGVGYKYNALNALSDNLEGVNMQTGSTIWKRDLDQTYGWDDIRRLNDSVILITSTGLHAVNLKTGLGWDYKTPTGKKQTGEAVAKGVGSVVLGVLTGVTVIPNIDIITGIVSNTLVDSSGIYLASSEKISRLNPDGNIVWSNELPKEMCSASDIFRDKGFVYLINKGYAYENGKMRDYGHPFVAVYKENDGSQVFFRNFDEKKLMLNDVFIQNDTINLLFHNKFVQLSQKNNTILAEKTFNTEITGYLYRFANSKTYLQENDMFVPARKDKSKYLVSTSNGNVLMLNDKLETEEELYKNTFHKLFYQKGSKKLLYNDGNMNAVDNDGKRLAEIKISSKIYLKGKKLYEVDGKILREIDLKELISE